MKEKIVGTIESLEEIHELKSGMGKKGKWTLWGTKLISEGGAYTLSGFDKKALEDQLKGRAIGDLIEFEIDQNDKGYWNIVTGSIKLAGQQTIHPGPKKESPKVTSEDLSLPPIQEMALIAEKAISAISTGIATIDSQDLLNARTSVFKSLLECEYAWRTARYIQACKEKNMENFRR